MLRDLSTCEQHLDIEMRFMMKLGKYKFWKWLLLFSSETVTILSNLQNSKDQDTQNSNFASCTVLVCWK